MDGREDSDRKTVVLAGNYHEFLFWCRENERNPRDRNLIYASDIQRIRGLGDVNWVEYGSFWLRRDALKLYLRRKTLEGRYCAATEG